MLNLVDKYSAETVQSEEGVVAIEYVLVAGAVAAGVIIAFGTSLWDNILDKLNEIVDG